MAELQTPDQQRIASYPAFNDVLRNAGIVATLMTAILIGLGYLMSSQIAEATRVSEYRLTVLERDFKEFKDQAKVTYTWRTVTETK